MKYACYLFLLVSLVACKKENTTPEESLFAGKVKSVHIYNTSGSTDILMYMKYDSSDMKLSAAFYKYAYPVSESSFGYATSSYQFTYTSDSIYIEEDSVTDNALSQYKVVLENNRISQILKNYDGIWGGHYNTIMTGDRVSKMYEPDFFPLSMGKSCDNYVFDGNNYTKFDFHYDYYTLVTNVHVDDTAYFTYTSLPFDKHAPAQNMFSCNTFTRPGATAEILYDMNYVLGFQDYFHYPPNRHLISSVRTTRDTSRKAFFDYSFNSTNQLSKVQIYFPDQYTLFLTYEIEYY